MGLLCKESFLEDIIRLQVYNAKTTMLPLPATIPAIISFAQLDLPAPLLDVSYGGEIMAEENTIKVSQSTQTTGSTTIYIYNVEVTCEGGLDVVRAVLPDLLREECYVVATNAEGSRFLLYTLPNTWRCEESDTQIKVKLVFGIQSLNNYIPIVV